MAAFQTMHILVSQQTHLTQGAYKSTWWKIPLVTSEEHKSANKHRSNVRHSRTYKKCMFEIVKESSNNVEEECLVDIGVLYKHNNDNNYYYTFEKRYYVFHLSTRFVCVCVCLCVCLSVCVSVCLSVITFAARWLDLATWCQVRSILSTRT